MTYLGDPGPLVIATDLDYELIATLQKWLPTYLSIFEGERGLAPKSLPRPKLHDIANSLTDLEFTDHTLPAIIVRTSGTDTTPIRNANQTYQADFRCVVSCVCRGQTPKGSRYNADVMAGSVERVLLQQGLPGSARTRYAGYGLQPVIDTTNQGRYLAAGILTFILAVDEVVQAGHIGPKVPDRNPYVPFAVVDGVDTIVTFGPTQKFAGGLDVSTGIGDGRMSGSFAVVTGLTEYGTLTGGR